MAELLTEVEYGRILGSFTAVAEDFGDTVAPDAIPLAGKVVFSPSISHVTYINSDGETASLYLHPVTASIVDGRLIGSEGNDGVVLLASNSNNVSASVLWTASIFIDPLGPDQDAPEVHKFLIEVSRNEISSLIDVIKANSRVHNVALFHDAIAEAAAKFWERVESGDFRGNQGPPGPAGVGIGVPGPSGRPGASGEDGEAGLGGNIIPDGDLEDPGFLVQGDYVESTDAYSGDKSVRLTHAVSRKIAIKPDKSYVGGVAVKADESVNVKITLRVFGHEGDIDRVIETTDTTHVGAWRELAFALDTKVGDQSLEIITDTDGRTITVDYYTLIDSTVIQGLQTRLSEAKAELDAAMADLAADLEMVDTERARLNESLNDLAAVLEDADVDLTVVNQELADLRVDLTTEETRRQEADAAAQLIMDQLNIELSDAAAELEANKTLLAGLDTELTTSQEKLTQAETNITRLETVTLPNLKQTLENATQEVVQNLATLDDKLYGASGDVTTAKANIDQLVTDLDIEEQARLQLAQDISEDFTKRDARLNAAEDTLATAFPDGAVNVSAELDRTIRDYVVEYAVSSSATIAPTTGWSVTSPTRTPGQYIWFRTKVVYGDGVASTSSAALLTGNEGEQGPKGEDGADGADGTGITILGSFDTEDELPASGSLGDSYLVGGYLFVWTDTGWDNVGLIQGPQGVPGEAGADGQPTYTWVKYADTSEGLGMSDDPSGKRYIGLAFNKDVQTESTTATDYQWALFEGPEGPEGVKGDPGDQGEQGVGVESITPFFRDVVRGSSAPASPTVWDPTGWTTAEPAWAPNRDLYRTERIRYTNDTFVYTPATKIAAYAGIDAAMEAANGKNLNTYTDLASSSKPGPAPAPDNSRTVGDIHRNRDKSTGEIWAEYQWTGTAWQEVSFGDGVLSSLDVGKVTGGTGAFQKFFADNLIADNATINKLWTDQLVGKTAAFNQIAVASGNILMDPNGLDPALRTNIGGAAWSWDDTGKYWTREAVQGGTTQFNAYTNNGTVYDSNLLDPGSMYVIKYEIWVDEVRPATLARASIYYRRTDGTTAFVGDGIEPGGDPDAGDPVVAGQWNKIERYWRAPSDVSSGGINFQLIHGGYESTEVRIRNPFVGKQAPAVLIEDGAVSAQKINAESVAGAVGKFINLETSQLIATDSIKTPEAVIDKLWADGISAKAIDTSRLSVSPSNVFPDPYFQDPGKWELSDGRVVIVEDEIPQLNYMRITTRDIQTGAYFGSSSDRPMSVTPGAEYKVQFQARLTSTADTGIRAGIALRTTTTSGGSPTTGSYVDIAPSEDWVTYEVSVGIYEDSVGIANVGIFDSSPYAAGNTLDVRSVRMTPMVGSVLIEDGAVNASKINAESVAAAVGQFVKVEAGNIVAGSADIDSLVAQKIAAATATFQTVNADKIIASTGKMETATINQIWADGIAAKALTTNKLTVASGNVIPDGDEMITEEQWSPLTRELTDKPASVIAARKTAPGQVAIASIGNQPFPITPGQEYSVQMWAKADKPGSRLYIEMRDAVTGDHAGTGTLEEPVVANTASYFIFNNREVPTEWTLFRGTWTAKEGMTSARFGSFYFNHSAGSERDASISIAGISMKPKVGAVLIADGAVSANKIAADSIDTSHLRALAITSDKIGANAIVAGKIAANAVDTDQLRANSVQADKISANAVIAGKIAADSVGAREIIANSITSEEILAGSITAEELAVGAVTAEKIAVGAIDAEKIHGGSFTGETFFGGVFEGGLIRTTPSGAGQVVLSDTAFTSSYNGNTDTAPGLAIIPSDTSDVSINPGIGPFEGGVSVDGGQNKSGGSAFMRTKPTGSLMYTFDPSLGRSMIETKPGEVLLTALNTISSGGGGGEATLTHDYSQLATTGTNGEYGDLHTTSTTARMRVVSPDGSVSWTEATSNLVHLTLLDTSGRALSTIRTDGRSAWMRANAGRNMEYSAIKADPTLVALTAYSSSAAVQSTARVNSNAAWLRTYGSTSDEYGLIQSGPDSAYIKANNGAGERRIEVTSTVARMFSKSATTGDGSRVEVDQGYVRIRRDVGGDARDDCGFDLSGQNAEMWGSDDNYKRGQIAAGKTGVVLNSGYGQQIYLRDGVITVSGQIDSTHKIKAQQLQMQNPPTTNISANVAMSSPSHSSAEERGRLYYITSSRRYKKNIIDWAPDVKSVLQMRPRLWQAKADDAPEGDDWVAGFIAEEIDDLGLTPLVRYGPDPEGGLRPEGLNYDRIGAAQQIVITKQEKEIQILIEENREIKSRLDRIEALLEKESV